MRGARIILQSEASLATVTTAGVDRSPQERFTEEGADGPFRDGARKITQPYKSMLNVIELHNEKESKAYSRTGNPERLPLPSVKERAIRPDHADGAAAESKPGAALYPHLVNTSA